MAENWPPASLAQEAPMRSLWIALHLLVALLPVTAAAQTADGETLADLLNLAYEQNPAIQEARAGLDAVKARVGHVGALPNPQLKATLFLVPIETRVGPQRLSLSATQSFPFPGTLSAKERVAQRQAEVAAAKLQGQIRTILNQVRVDWYELHYLTRALEIIAQSRLLADRIAGAGGAAFGKGDIPYFDYNRAQAELARLSYDEAALSDLRTTKWHELNALLGREPPPLPEISPLPSLSLHTPLEQLPELLVANRPEIAAAHRQEEMADAAIELTEKSFWPGFGVGVSWLVHEAEGAAPDRGKDALGLTIGIDVPIWRASLHARADEARALRRQAGLAVASETSRARQALADGIYDYVNARRLLTLYDGNLLPQAATALHSAEAESQTPGNFGTLLERQAIYLQFSLARERALANLYQATARLEQVVGTPLDYVAEKTAPGPSPESAPPSAETLTAAPKEAPGRNAVRGEVDPGHISHNHDWRKAGEELALRGTKGALSHRLSKALLDKAILRQNPDIKRADRAVAETLERFPQVAYLDHLVSQYADLSAQLKPPQGGMAPGSMNQADTTGPGSLSLKSAVAQTELEQAQVQAGLTRRKVVTQARLALADYRYAVAAARVVEELATVTGQLQEIANQRVAAGSGRATDVLQAEMLHAELLTTRANLDDLAGQAKARMATLLALPADLPFGPIADLGGFTLPDKESLTRRAGSRQELRLKDLEKQRLQQVIALIQSRSFPDLNTGQSDLAVPLAKDGQMAFPTQPMVKEDIYSGGRQAYLDELTRRLETISADRRRLTQEITNEIAQAHLALKTALRNRNLHGKSLAKTAQQVLDLTLSQYRQGTASFSELLVAQRDAIRHRLGTLEAIRAAEKATARLQDAALWRE